MASREEPPQVTAAKNQDAATPDYSFPKVGCESKLSESTRSSGSNGLKRVPKWTVLHEPLLEHFRRPSPQLCPTSPESRRQTQLSAQRHGLPTGSRGAATNGFPDQCFSPLLSKREQPYPFERLPPRLSLRPREQGRGRNPEAAGRPTVPPLYRRGAGPIGGSASRAGFWYPEAAFIVAFGMFAFDFSCVMSRNEWFCFNGR